jgi:hypothetical protein
LASVIFIVCVVRIARKERPISKITNMRKLTFYILFIVFSVPGLAQVERKVIIEHFTNTRCGICASRNPAFFQTLEDYPQVQHIAYHPSAPYSNCVFNQHNPAENDERTNYYGIYGATPRVVIQGEVIPSQNPLIRADQIDEKLGGQSDYQVTVTKTPINTNRSKVTVSVTKVSGSSDAQTLKVYVALAEETINYNAPNGEDVHHNVFRRKVIDESVTIEGVEDSETLEAEYDHHPDWDVDEIYAYAIIQDPASKEIHQTANSMESPSFINTNAAEEIGNLFYPNPASSVINIMPEYRERFRSIELFSFVGNRIAEFEETTLLDVSTLPDGMYFLVATDQQNRRFTSRLIVNH